MNAVKGWHISYILSRHVPFKHKITWHSTLLVSCGVSRPTHYVSLRRLWCVQVHSNTIWHTLSVFKAENDHQWTPWKDVTVIKKGLFNNWSTRMTIIRVLDGPMPVVCWPTSYTLNNHSRQHWANFVYGVVMTCKPVILSMWWSFWWSFYMVRLLSSPRPNDISIFYVQMLFKFTEYNKPFRCWRTAIESVIGFNATLLCDDLIK